MMRKRLTLLILPALLLGACDSGNPVAPPPPDPGSPSGSSDASVVVLTSDRGQLEAGSVQGATLTVSARTKDGAPATDGTEVVLNTSLGSFGVDASGKPVQLVKKPLAGGATHVQFFPGKEQGTASILAQVGTGVGKLNLPIVGPSAPPVAEFTFEVSGLSVLFADASTGNPVAWDWDFGDGDSVSGRQGPAHTYALAGTYTVALTIKTENGAESTKRKFVTVQAGLPLTAAFGYEVNGLTVLFTDISTGEPVSWTWELGDGGVSAERNPSHKYSKPGNYTVRLTVQNVYGVAASTSKFVSPSLGDAPQADFEYQADGLRVLFTDASKGNPTDWTWDFGDGSSSGFPNPEHLFAKPGTYNVTLTARNAAGSNSKSKFVAVSLGEPPKADFEVQVNGLAAVFLDRSTGKPMSWTWEFGACSGPLCQSTEQNPTYNYSAPGTYTVILTAANSAGTSRASKLVTVGNSGPPAAAFCYQRNGLVVIFTDKSKPGPSVWQWNFGDCEAQAATCKSASQNPGHTYAEAKVYAVSLTAGNSAGQTTETHFVEVGSIVDPGSICP
jgi:PKD repeat protein